MRHYLNNHGDPYQTAKDYNLVINNKKSGIFIIGRGKVDDEHFLDIPIVDTYRYLGVQITRDGRMRNQID